MFPYVSQLSWLTSSSVLHSVRNGTWPRGYTKAGWIVVGAAGLGRGGVTRLGRRDKVEATRRDRGGGARSGYHKKGGERS